jgi:hypothetical protein
VNLQTFAKSSLVPSVNPVAVRAQKLKVADILFPVCNSATPIPNVIFGLFLCAAFNMVNVQSSKIRKSALAALSAKMLNYFSPRFPIPRLLVNRVAVLIPKITTAIRRAKNRLGIFAASLALSICGEAAGDITGGGAEKLRRMCWGNLKSLSAFLTIFVHANTVNAYCMKDKINFKTACARLEAECNQGALL